MLTCSPHCWPLRCRQIVDPSSPQSPGYTTDLMRSVVSGRFQYDGLQLNAGDNRGAPSSAFLRRTAIAAPAVLLDRLLVVILQ